VCGTVIQVWIYWGGFIILRCCINCESYLALDETKERTWKIRTKERGNKGQISLLHVATSLVEFTRSNNNTTNEIGFICFETSYQLRMTVFWRVAPYSLTDIYQNLKGACCLHHRGYHMDMVAACSFATWAVYLPVHTALQPTRQPSSYSPLWVPQISHSISYCLWTYSSFLTNI
jgi:hypothetical protein